MGEAAEDTEFREEQKEVEYLLHKQGNCQYPCVYCEYDNNLISQKEEYMLIEQQRKDGEPVAVIECKEFLGSIDIYPQYGFCIFDAEKDSIKRTEKCPSIGDEIRCHVLEEEGENENISKNK